MTHVMYMIGASSYMIMMSKKMRRLSNINFKVTSRKYYGDKSHKIIRVLL
jgi:hypothetical protein